MKKFLNYSLSLIIIPLIVVILNLVTDYKGMFGISNSFVLKIVSNHLSKKNVELFVDYPGREIVKSKIALLKNQNLNKVVIGSSRTLQLGIPISLKLNNFSVSSASLKDYKLILDLIENNQIKVDSIIFDTNESLFNSLDQNNNFKILNGTNKLEKIKALWSLSYLKLNLKLKKINSLYGFSENFISLYDGSIQYPKKYTDGRYNGKNKINAYVKQSTNLNNYLFDKYKFNEFFNVLRTQSYKVKHLTLFISPVPLPIYKKDILLFKKIEDRLYKEIREFKNVSIIGSFNPEKFGINDLDYLDHAHLYRSGLLKIFNN